MGGFQVEARLRQLEGKMLASDSGVARGKADIARYDPSRQGAAGAALLTAPKAYNLDADVTADAGKEQKKAKKKKVGPPPRTHRSRLALNLNFKKCSACLLGWETASVAAADTWLSADLCSFLGWDDDRLAWGLINLHCAEEGCCWRGCCSQQQRGSNKWRDGY